MKKFKLISIFLLLIIVTTALTSCPIAPHAFEWDLYSITKDVTYINGNTLSTQILQGVAYYNPNGIHSQMTYIEFFEDGTLIFKPLDENELKGTYKCKNNGIQNTTVYITLENGEEIEALGVGAYYEDVLYIEYHNTKYKFSSSLGSMDICEDEKEYQEQLRAFAENLRYAEENQKYSYIRKAAVVFDENGGATLISDDEGTEEIDLYSKNLGVIAIRLTDNNEIMYLDSIEAGECYYYGTFSTERTSYINLFYLDPLPNHEEENPKIYSLFDLIPELEAFYTDEAREDINIKMGIELKNARPGLYNFYNRLTDREQINNILDALADMRLYETDAHSDEFLSELYSLDTVRIRDSSGKAVMIYNIYDRIKIGEKWYYHGNSFPDFVYEGAYQKFICQNYAAELYQGEIFQYYTNILGDLEYIVDPNQDYSYSSLHDTRTLVCEIGEITVYDETHFWYKGQFYLSVGERSFAELFE